jgi:SMC interacting uncharacterized protein involved in chromosome segregation
MDSSDEIEKLPVVILAEKITGTLAVLRRETENRFLAMKEDDVDYAAYMQLMKDMQKAYDDSLISLSCIQDGLW